MFYYCLQYRRVSKGVNRLTLYCRLASGCLGGYQGDWPPSPQAPGTSGGGGGGRPVAHQRRASGLSGERVSGYLLVLTLAAIALANTIFGFVEVDLLETDEERVEWPRQR